MAIVGPKYTLAILALIALSQGALGQSIPKRDPDIRLTCKIPNVPFDVKFQIWITERICGRGILNERPKPHECIISKDKIEIDYNFGMSEEVIDRNTWEFKGKSNLPAVDFTGRCVNEQPRFRISDAFR
jgi:hypothetical protein